MSQNTYIFQLFSLPTEIMYKKVTHALGSICRCVCNRRAERTNSSPVSRKQGTKLYWESILFSIYMKTLSEAIEFGVVVVRFVLVVRVFIPGLNNISMDFYLELHVFGAVPVRKKDEILD